MAGDPGAHLPDRPEPVDDDAAAPRDVGVLHGLPGGWQHVGEVYEAVVGRSVGHLDWAELRLRHAQELGLTAGDLAVELRVAEQRGALALVAHLRRLALRVEVLVAHVAVAA